MSFILFLLFNNISRLVLFSFAIFEREINFSFLHCIEVFGLGFVNDIATAFYFLTFVFLIKTIIPIKFTNSKLVNLVRYTYYFILIIVFSFLVIAEFTFWLEFSTRFNFIAVDYLIYTTEVFGNIRESYPLHLILPALLLFSSLVFYLLFDKFKPSNNHNKTKKFQLVSFLLISLVSMLVFKFYDPKITDVKTNNYVSELNKNGLYNLFSAFLNNSIDYNKFYLSKDPEDTYKNLANFVSGNENLERIIKKNGETKNYNVILITIESLSSNFINQIHYGKILTPNLNKLSEESIDFTNYYATGTRTVRGLEAITLSIPPIPGQSILRRKHNENLFSIASVLKNEDYDIKFIYGGYGYFDNMNYFFANNNFKVIDRNIIKPEEIEFANVWGISDEDLYRQVIKQADDSYKNKQKFFSLVMTTSNHRPYTYPEGKIAIPPKSGREGGVMYTDYALGVFLKEAAKKPWFDNTIFVITADHCAGSAGKIALPPEKYHIPLFFYAPKILESQKITKLASQIDLAPTILSILNISYKSKFFGNDLFSNTKENAFISTFQKLGYMRNNKLVVLSPNKQVNTYEVNKDSSLKEIHNDDEFTNESVNYYESAYNLFVNNRLKENE